MSTNIIWSDRKRPIFGLPISFTKYILTDEKLLVDTGFLSRTQEEIRLFPGPRSGACPNQKQPAPFRAGCLLFMGFQILGSMQNSKLSLPLTSIRYSSCVLAPQLSSPPTPICARAARMTVKCRSGSSLA